MFRIALRACTIKWRTPPIGTYIVTPVNGSCRHQLQVTYLCDLLHLYTETAVDNYPCHQPLFGI